jgi:SAM-dependent methyltransferase
MDQTGGRRGLDLIDGRPAYGDVEPLYRARFSASDRARKADLWQVLVADFLQRWVAPDDCVLDLGCGHGEFLNVVQCRRRIGVDVNPESARYLRPEVEFHQASAAGLRFVADGQVDLVFSSNVLEHLADKAEVERLLDEVARVTRAGGHLVLLGPNLRYLPGSYWDFWDHLVPITDRAMREVLQAKGFRITDLHPKFLPYTTRSRLPQSALLVKWYLRMPLAWSILGRQFLIRAEAPGPPLPWPPS